MNYPSFIEISKSALRHNISFLRNYLNPNVRISSVVKSNAYGHGIEAFVPVAEECGLDHFSVFSLDEAYVVKNSLKSHADIMVMGWIDLKDVIWAVEQEIEAFVFELGTLHAMIAAAKITGKKALVHLEVETGMNRTGLAPADMKKAVELISKDLEMITIKGLCTHYAGAESVSNYLRITNQFKKFKQKQRWLTNQAIVPENIHTACSAACIAYPNTQMDMVRIGILQYGFWPSPETFIYYLHNRADKTDPLKRVISWKSNIMSIKNVREGEFVSYGITYLAKSDIRIAIIPTGYSNGYSRSLSNQGRVLIGGQRVGVIGMVNMNTLIADITGIEGVEVGDEVVFIGKQGELTISVSSFTEFSDQLNYELLARLPANIPRIVVD